MARGKHVAPKTKRRFWPLWLAVAVIVLAASFGGVAAYLSTTAGPVDNSFSIAGEKDPVIPDYSVSIPDDLGYAVYVRAAVVFNWKDGNGNVLAQAPVAGTDYTVSMNEAAWFEYGGFWYCKNPVAPGTSTPALISSLNVKTARDGFSLTADIAAQTIQALGSTDGDDPYADGIPAVTDAWGVAVSNAELTLPTG